MGPTKEELNNYFKNNRKYFDELAHHYKQTDPEYYNKSIAPFYITPFVYTGSKRAVRPAIAVFAAALFVFVMGIVLFFMVNQKSFNEEIEKEEIENEIESDQIKITDTLSSLKDLGDYEKGMLYFQLEEYDKAEKYLLRVSVDSPFYKDAKIKLIEIKRKKLK